MGTYKSVYVGGYVKVYPPKEDIQYTISTCDNKTCRNHKRDLQHSKFCDACGSGIKPCTFVTSKSKNMHEYIYDKFKNEDMFQVVYQENLCDHDNENFVLLLPNHERQGGIFIGTHEHGEFPFHKRVKDQMLFEEWQALIKNLQEDNIKHEIIEGCVAYSL